MVCARLVLREKRTRWNLPNLLRNNRSLPMSDAVSDANAFHRERHALPVVEVR